MSASSRRRARRQWLIGRDGVPPGGKRFGSVDEIFDRKGDEEFGHDVHACQSLAACGELREVKYGLECFELHLDLPPKCVELENVCRGDLLRKVGHNEDVASGFKRANIDGCALAPFIRGFLPGSLRGRLTLPNRYQTTRENRSIGRTETDRKL